MDVILCIGARRCKTIMAMTRFRATVILAQVITTLQAVTTITTSLVRLASHAVARLKIQHAFSNIDNLARPLVAWDKGIRWRPGASQIAAQDLVALRLASFSG
jgi:hypothetical protein